MAKYHSILFLIVFPLYCFGQSGVLVIKNVNVIDVKNNKVTGNSVAIIEGNKIISTGNKTAIPKKATVIDAQDKFLIPGLWDMHTHSLRKERLSYFFPLFIANGVTGIRDMASDMSLAEIMLLQHDIETSKITGPALFV